MFLITNLRSCCCAAGVAVELLHQLNLMLDAAIVVCGGSVGGGSYNNSSSFCRSKSISEFIWADFSFCEQQQWNELSNYDTLDWRQLKTTSSEREGQEHSNDRSYVLVPSKKKNLEIHNSLKSEIIEFLSSIAISWSNIVMWPLFEKPLLFAFIWCHF